MAQQNTGCGCGTLIALVALGFVLAYWQVFLVAALLVLAIAAVVWAVLLQNQEQLRVLVEAAERRVQLVPCQIQNSFGVIRAIKLAGSLQTPRIDVHCSTLTSNGNAVVADEICLSPPAERQQLRTSTGLASWLRSGGITQLEELSVEARPLQPPWNACGSGRGPARLWPIWMVCAAR